MAEKDKIFRLLNYRNLLNRLKSIGFVKVFSDNIADTLDVSPSLVRKDFREFSIKGTPKGGYNIESIIKQIDEILGKSEPREVIIVGVGKIGQALMRYPGFAKEGFHIIAGFDNDPEKINEKASIPVLPITKIVPFVTAKKIKYAILCVPESGAMGAMELLEAAGIEGVLNFTSINLKSDQVVIQDINIGHALENVIFSVNTRKIKH